MIGLAYLLLTDFSNEEPNQIATVTPTSEPVISQEPTVEPTIQPEETEEPQETETPQIEVVDTTSDDSLQRIVNKQNPISADYVPSDLTMITVNAEKTQYLRSEANEKLSEMFEAAENDGIHLVLISGYRSYETETELYQFWVTYAGQEEADQIDCQPGYSEHQLGLAVDIGAESKACRLDECFASTTEGQWLANHAYQYGYILRYPEGKQSITGIIYSPWNYRYVGVEEATKLYESGLTMEEYYEVEE